MRLQRQAGLSGCPSRSATTVAPPMCRRKVPFGMRAAEGNRDQVVEGQLAASDGLTADVAVHAVALNDHREVNHLGRDGCLSGAVDVCASQQDRSPLLGMIAPPLSNARLLPGEILPSPLGNLSILLVAVAQMTCSTLRDSQVSMRQVPLHGRLTCRHLLGFGQGCIARLLRCSAARLAGIPQPVGIAPVRGEGGQWLRFAAAWTTLHSVSDPPRCSRYPSTMRRTSSATEMPSQRACSFRKVICGSVNEIICFCIPTVYHGVSIGGAR